MRLTVRDRVLYALAGEPGATMSAKMVHQLVNKEIEVVTRLRNKPARLAALSSVKRTLRRLRAEGLADVTLFFDRELGQRVGHWSISDAALDMGRSAWR